MSSDVSPAVDGQSGPAQEAPNGGATTAVYEEDKDLSGPSSDTSTATGEGDKPQPSQSDLSPKPTKVENSDDEYDTDLEVEEEKKAYNLCAETMYLDVCKKFGLIPVKYFLSHLDQAQLKMRHHGLGAQGAFAISVPLLTNTSVNSLDLADNWLEEAGGRAVADMLKENLYITELGYFQLTSDVKYMSIECVGGFLHVGHVEILSQNKLGCGGAKYVCEMLEVNTTLLSIDLSENSIGDECADALETALLENSRLKELNISHNDLGDKAGKAFGHILADNDGLERLNLSWNKIRRRSAVALCEGLKSSGRLKYLYLAYNGLGNEGAITLADSLKGNTCLLELDITCNRIHVQGAEALAKGLEANDSLKTLKMGLNPLGCTGTLAVLNAVGSERSAVTCLDLSRIEVNKEFVIREQEVVRAKKVRVLRGIQLENYVIKGPTRKSTDNRSDESFSAVCDTE